MECFYTIADGFLWLELKYLKCKAIFSLPNFAWFLQSLSGEQGVFVPLNLTKGHSKKGASQPLVFVMLAATQFLLRSGNSKFLHNPGPDLLSKAFISIFSLGYNKSNNIL